AGSLDPNTRATSSWWAASTLSPNRRASRTIGRVRALFSKHTSASSGSSDSEQTALAVIPPSSVPVALVTTATPVANRPNTSRNSSGSPTALRPRYTVRARMGRRGPGRRPLWWRPWGRSRHGGGSERRAGRRRDRHTASPRSLRVLPAPTAGRDLPYDPAPNEPTRQGPPIGRVARGRSPDDRVR